MSINYIYEKLAYIKGLSDGLDIKEDTKEAKLLLSIVDMLEDFVDIFADIQENQEELEEYIESIDEDIADIEDEMLRFEDEDDFNTVEIVCPNCGETIYVDEGLMCDKDIEIVCPNCKNVIMNDEELEGIEE
ncbi:hypothetical protein SAMN02745945_00675 [Peptoclostridium litorale DSM 5388]|uniref:AraC family transcriptional regulator n=1 Tax=Peptoclostridium litorale DSM 5388 TaxID=1121324 RepID=A0A069RCM7_PEPLI|nr:CD1247 N-terminal domain-containing protein [Peptoclostridium litorale]KDR93995.1 hypothetical protein CLIT_23c02670 [Peptoclostridium litorale DSM 5388]SIN79267.1 hypothetical protein SAMN02745945_00675 [Peptoclostridium litorale DSM 5388]